MPDPDRVAVLEKNLTGWIRTASLEEIRTILHVVGRELLTARLPPGQIERAGSYAWHAADLLRNVTEVTVTNLTDHPNRVALNPRPTAPPASQ